MRNVAGDLLHSHMQRAFSENPRGELYRTLSRQDLWNKLTQNLEEIKIAVLHGDNDLADKLADAGNYLAFLYRNHVDPLETANREYTLLQAALHGLVLTREQADQLITLVHTRTLAKAENNLLVHER